MNRNDALLEDWRSRALRLEAGGAEGGDRPGDADPPHRDRRCSRAATCLLEGDVGVGKTTLLRAVARAIGGAYERIEGTIDLMPNDLVYYTYISEEGRPRVDPGPLLKHGGDLPSSSSTRSTAPARRCTRCCCG